MDLFDNALEERFAEYAPLAARMRPRTLDEIVGQRHLLGEGKALRALVASGDLSSIVLWGPAGTGKTTLAHVIAGTSSAHFEPMSAVASGVADVRKVIEAARDRLAQQDALLPAVENGWIVLVGATTENPSFEVNTPLMSRSLLFRLEALTEEDLIEVLRRALGDAERGIGGLPIEVDEEAVAHIAAGAGGDARAALNALEAAASIATSTGGRVDLGAAEEALQRRALPYDKSGDWHYDVISAFIKSMRGSDPDAAVYWMVRMLDAGEDPRFICRRMVIFASEDVGNADPTALEVAVAAHRALEFVGLPEAKLNMAQAAVYLALAPKSNASAVALWRAEADLEAGPLPVPAHLRDSHSPASRSIGAGKGYLYPHDHGGYVEQDYLPEALRDRRYFAPVRGAEAALSRSREHRRGDAPRPKPDKR
ncbi:MAG: replication-associated recombination protein A [Actinomycetota bacterium]